MDGRLTMAELSDRAQLTEEARTLKELRQVTSDLGASPRGNTQAPGLPVRRGAFLSSLKLHGRWRTPAVAHYRATLGSIKIDLRNAVLPEPEIELHFRVILGSVEVLVPSGSEVTLQGGGFMVSLDHESAETAAAPGGPALLVTVSGFASSVKIRSRATIGERLKHAVLARLGDGGQSQER